MIPLCQKCGSEDFSDQTIPGASARSASLLRTGVVFVILTITTFILVYYSYWFLLAAVISLIISIVAIVQSGRIPVAVRTCKRCGWQEKR